MVKTFLNRTDSFLCDHVRGIFAKVEGNHKSNQISINISQELKNFEANPLTCVVGCDTKFEANIKTQVKLMIGKFFVAIPMIILLLITYMLSLTYSYAFVFTFIIAVLATSRIDKIAKRYVTTRGLELV